MSQNIIPMHQAKSSLSRLVKRAAAGEVIFIGSYGRAESRSYSGNQCHAEKTSWYSGRKADDS